MSRRLWYEVLNRITYDDLSAQLVFQCAPLFAGLKVSNLLKIREENLIRAIQILKNLGYHVKVLLTRDGKVSMLVYDLTKLSQYLCRSDVRELLRTFGYQAFSFRQLMESFVERYRQYGEGEIEYPHETGLFLGYPAADVEGFVKNQGKNFLHSGYWKVYRDAQSMKALFAQFEEAKRGMLFQLARGRELTEFLKDPAFRGRDTQVSL